MKITSFPLLGLPAMFALSCLAQASTLTPLTPFEPVPEDTPGFVAGVDFDDGSNTQPGFLGIPASNDKSYDVTTNGVNFNMVATNANLGNANRDRGARGGNSTFLTRDFEQWYGNTGTAPEFAVTISGLTPNSDYEIHVWHFNMGAGQNSLNMFDGASSSDPLIGVSQTSGNEGNYGSWTSGAILGMTSDGSGTIVFTAQASSATARININGIMVVATAPPVAPKITSITPVSGNVWELTLEGEPNTDYEFRSDAVLAFDPGTLVENLAPAATPTGTIGGTNDSVLTTDGNGLGAAQLTLTGAPRDFVRAEALPSVP